MIGGLVLVLAGTGCQPGSDVQRQGEPRVPRIAVVDAGGVRIRGSSGTFSTVAEVPPGWRAEGLVWSADGTQLAWLAVEISTGTTLVVRAAATGGSPRQWACALYCGPLAFRGTELISGGDGMGTMYRYPASGTEDPDPLGIDGLPDGISVAVQPAVTLLTGTGKPDGLIVAAGHTGTASTGVYRVGADGDATLLHDTGGSVPPLTGALSDDGRQLAYTVNRTGGGCPLTETVVLVETASGQGVPVTPPTSAAPLFVADLWFDEAGTAYASYVAGPTPCPTDARPPATPTRPTVAKVYRRDGTTWRSTGARASQGADLGSGRTALLTGPLTTGPDGIHSSPAGALTLSDSTGSDQVLATRVTSFAVAPA